MGFNVQKGRFLLDIGEKHSNDNNLEKYQNSTTRNPLDRHSSAMKWTYIQSFLDSFSHMVNFHIKSRGTENTENNEKANR